MDCVKMEPLLLSNWLIKSFVWQKLQLAFWCNWLWKVLRLCDVSSLQDMSSLLFIGMAWLGSIWGNAFR